ncbi:MAG: hypothetical protein L0322_09225 [Chloroflexi bacterium]|nr:hypothetical protein [Chloroflexota bacterium]MCI0577269.1 hypothetical protein [Chloroflexota bacterium]MCI0649503.1 hypothetical protein [Chloroflexota bacterium]
MRKVTSCLILALLLVVAVACTGGATGDPTAEPPPELAGPALVMFYTDN